MSRITTGQVREILFECLQKAAKGKMDPKDARSVIGTANQLTHNLGTELKNRELEIRLGGNANTVAKLGDLGIGDPSKGPDSAQAAA
ncbi:MAG: hypothetical protein ACU843_16990 [Gammaproteobacteria bacterium]